MSQYQTYTLEEAIKRLEQYCSYQERCHQDVNKKLFEMRMIPEAIDLIKVHLINNDFLNEERFAKAFVRGKFKIKKWGKRRLTLELKKRDISKAIIHIAIGQIEAHQYMNVFNVLAKKKAVTLKETNILKKKKKLANYLLYRGWESYLVYDKVNDLIK